MPRREPGQRPGSRGVLRTDLPGPQRGPDPDEGQQDIPGVGFQVVKELRHSGPCGAEEVLVRDGVQQLGGRRADQRGIALPGHGDQDRQIRRRLRLRNRPLLVGVPEPLAVQEVLPRWVSPGLDVPGDHHAQLHRSRRSGAGAGAGALEQARDQGRPLGIGQRSLGHDQQVEIARRSQPAQDRRSVQVDAEQVRAQHVGHEAHDAPNLLRLGTVDDPASSRHDTGRGPGTRRRNRKRGRDVESGAARSRRG